MNNFINDFEQSLEKGFINKSITSKREYLPQFILNDKEKGKKVLTFIQRELLDCDEFWFSVAFITKSGVATLINTFKELEEKGVNGKILVSQYLNFTQPEALKALLQFKNIEAKIVVNDDFHAKGYLFKKDSHYNLIIGSSNLTGNALCLNKEWNLKISATQDSHIINKSIQEFTSEFDKATLITNDFINKYSLIFDQHNKVKFSYDNNDALNIIIEPNTMQNEALDNLSNLRRSEISKALLISATGTGKTYLSAFDIKNVNPRKALFIVHRLNIAKAALKTFKTIFGASKSMGLYSGNYKNTEADFIFSTVQTISKDKHRYSFSPDHFDYIVIDETHRAGAKSYQNILEYFKPSFLLGMTATPERTDGEDIFKLFDHNIAYEIRLHKAMEEKMLSPFHYYGVTDIYVQDEGLSEVDDFRVLTADERVDRILEKANFYGCDNGEIRGLVFCSKVAESKILSDKINERGFKSISLSGSNNEQEREEAIERLESNNPLEKIDYIFTVDIFNEGIDIPKVNQVIMLRPTQSAIIFVQQLGRGLRKVDNKEYLTVIDFIGNYKNNYLVPIALFGDTSYNKDTLRKLMADGNNIIPGASTINFDKISRERIYESIDSANMQMKKDLVNDYKLLKYKIGYSPMMIDFLEHGSRDPILYVNYSKSYFNFVTLLEDDLKQKLSEFEIKLLENFSREINNTKRVEESIILKELILNNQLTVQSLKEIIEDTYNYEVKEDTISSCVNNINFEFATQAHNRQRLSIKEIYDYNNLKLEGDSFEIQETLSVALKNDLFKQYLVDNVEYSIRSFNEDLKKSKFFKGFILYQKYSRKDVFRIMNWKQNPLAQNVGGYMVSKDKSNCPIFVNYHKEEDISSTTKYEDTFINNSEFSWMSKSKRTLKSPDVMAIKNYKSGIRLPLFIKKSNDEGTEFYYMGDLKPIDNSFIQTTMPGENNKEVSVVKINFNLSHPVEDSIFNYITNND